MRQETRKKFNAYVARQASINHADDASQSFAVEPSVQQKLESKIQESSEFLSKINVIGVDEKTGQKLGMGVSSTIAGRTDVTKTDRQPRDVHSLEAHDYECVSTEYDTGINWATLDAWAKFPDFQRRLRAMILRRQALDRIMIGFNGTSAATQTNRATNPLLQDVNIGWLEQYRLHARARVLSGVQVGTGREYRNIDALVYDAINELLDPWHREDTQLVAIVGRKLLADKYFPMINKFDKPNEARAADLIISQKRIGGAPGAQAPFVPDNAVFITTFDNLSLYWQAGARRSYVIDNPKRNRIENYDSSNDAYVVEDYGRGCLIEGIEMSDAEEGGE